MGDYKNPAEMTHEELVQVVESLIELDKLDEVQQPEETVVLVTKLQHMIRENAVMPMDATVEDAEVDSPAVVEEVPADEAEAA